MFQMRQCQNERCRFRFPVSAGDLDGATCPKCGSPTTVSGEPFSAHIPPEADRTSGPRVEALLDNIRSVFNVGAMFRTADGAGLRRLHLCGMTATPEHPRLAKTALGAEQVVPWSYYLNALDAARQLKKQGAMLWALESAPGSESLFRAVPRAGSAPLILIVGNERAGIDPGLLSLCHRVLHIPMGGVKESLNVAIAFGVAAYYMRYAHAGLDIGYP